MEEGYGDRSWLPHSICAARFIRDVCSEFLVGVFIGGALTAALSPEGVGYGERLNVPPTPPILLSSSLVEFVVVDGAKRHRKLVAHLQSDPSRLREADVVRLRGRASADDAWLARDEAEMFLRPDPPRFRDGEDALVDLRTTATAAFRRWHGANFGRGRALRITRATAHCLRC